LQNIVSQSPSIPYVAFLRGINVGGHKLISKDALIGAFEAAGFTEVRTVIQSGNVLFCSPEKNRAKLTKAVEAALHKATGHEVPVMIRTRAEIAALVKSDPFGKDKEKPRTLAYVAFLESEPAQDKLEKLLARQTEDDRIEVRKLELIHLLTRDPGQMGFSTDFVEKDLKLKATVRNWNTVTKIAGL
jgi:uncharacterized protein (DUF1697 family)